MFMVSMSFSEASENYGPRPITNYNSVTALIKMLKASKGLLYVIDHPIWKNTFAQVDHYLNIPVIQGIMNDTDFGFILKGNKLFVVKHRAQWHIDKQKTRLINTDQKTSRKFITAFERRVSALIG